MPDGHSPNLISRFMKLMLAQLSPDWEQRWGHPLALVETFVDPRFYQGTAYKVSGWCHLGRSAGWHREADDFYEKNDAPKQIWVRELVKQACVTLRASGLEAGLRAGSASGLEVGLRAGSASGLEVGLRAGSAPKLPPPWAKVDEAVSPDCTAKAAQIRSLMESVQAGIPEFRRPQSLGYPVAGLTCLTVMALAQGVARGPQDLAHYADTLSQAQLRALGFRRDGDTGDIRCPKATTFSRFQPVGRLPGRRRFLHGVDDEALERVLLQWQDQLLGPSQDRIVIIDGKKVRHGGVEIVNAVDSTGRFLGSVITESKSNEIPAGRQLLRKLDLVGKIVLALWNRLWRHRSGARHLFHGAGRCPAHPA